jgi:hypothetical protein
MKNMMNDYFHVEDEMIRLANLAQERYNRGFTYWCPYCEWFYEPTEVEEQTDGISDTLCPECKKPLQQEGNK